MKKVLLATIIFALLGMATTVGVPKSTMAYTDATAGTSPQAAFPQSNNGTNHLVKSDGIIYD